MVSLARAGFCVYRRDLSAQNPPEGKHSLPVRKTDKKKDHGGERIMDMTGMKHEIEALAEAHREEFEAVSACIFEHPELAFQERGHRMNYAAFWNVTAFL